MSRPVSASLGCDGDRPTPRRTDFRTQHTLAINIRVRRHASGGHQTSAAPTVPCTRKTPTTGQKKPGVSVRSRRSRCPHPSSFYFEHAAEESAVPRRRPQKMSTPENYGQGRSHKAIDEASRLKRKRRNTEVGHFAGTTVSPLPDGVTEKNSP